MLCEISGGEKGGRNFGCGMMVSGEATHPQRVRGGDLAKCTRGCGGKTEGEME